MWRAEISAVSSLRVQTGRHQRRPDSAVRKQSARQWKLEWDATLMALSPTHYRERSGESSGSSHSTWTSASVRTGNSSCGSRRALRWSSARRGPYRPSPASAMTPAAGPILRVGAVLSFLYPAYPNSQVQSQPAVWIGPYSSDLATGLADTPWNRTNRRHSNRRSLVESELCT